MVFYVTLPLLIGGSFVSLSGVFSPSVCSFIAERDYENHNSGILAWVTSFTGENPVGLIELNKFVFGANPRIDILQRVVVWQRAKRRAVSSIKIFKCNVDQRHYTKLSKSICLGNNNLGQKGFRIPSFTK